MGEKVESEAENNFLKTDGAFLTLSHKFTNETDKFNEGKL